MSSHKTPSKRPLLRISLKNKIKPVNYELQSRAPKSNIAKKNTGLYTRPINIDNNSPVLKFNIHGRLTPVDKNSSRGGKSRSNKKPVNKSKRLYK
jgi:hypothetical protein